MTGESPTAKMLCAAKTLLQESGEKGLTMPRLAGQLGVPLSDLYAKIPRLSIIYAELIDALEINLNDEAAQTDEARYDLLLDFYMQRFETMQAEREVYLAVTQYYLARPQLWPERMINLQKRITRTLEDLGFMQPKRRSLPVAYAYLRALKTWSGDANGSLDATFSRLDRGLRRALTPLQQRLHGAQ